MIRTVLVLLAVPCLYGDSTASLPLMPWPAKVRIEKGTLRLPSGFAIATLGAGVGDSRVQTSLRRAARLLGKAVIARQPAAQMTVTVNRADHPAPQKAGDGEAYTLQITSERVALTSETPLGVVRGLETLLELARPCGTDLCVPLVEIQDEPRFAWRGLSLDVSRHFVPVDGIKRTLDGMAAVKLNVLHFHLTDDQGFRMESKKFPRLQELGSGGLYYTQDQIGDLVEYARERGIRVVPEFDVPGHATSWLAGYPSLASHKAEWELVDADSDPHGVLDPTRESTYQFLDSFFGEMAKVFPDEYVHIGGDEVQAKVWMTEPKIRAFMRAHRLSNASRLQAYFNARLQVIVARHGKKMIGWDETLDPRLPASVVVQSWRGDRWLIDAVRKGHSGILSAGYYLDLMQPASQHYLVDPLPQSVSLDDEQKKRVLGGEAAMWNELATAENLDTKLWPRLAAIAERLWSPESVADVDSMYARLDTASRRLEALGLTHRSALEQMRERLAGTQPVGPLDALASLLEPVKGYERHRNHYPISYPLNRLVDSIPPESQEGREFRSATDKFIAFPDPAGAEVLRKLFARWLQVAQSVRPVLESNPLLEENLPWADALSVMSQTGLDAVSYMTTRAPDGWKDQAIAAVKDAATHKAGLLSPIAPAIQKLVDAVPSPATTP